MALPKAAFQLTWRNTRRYGGYLVHLGIVAMFVGFTGSAFNLHVVENLGLGQTTHFGHYDIKLVNVNDGSNDNYEFSHAVVDVCRNGREITLLEPEIRLYKASQSQNTVVGLRRALNEDPMSFTPGFCRTEAKQRSSSISFRWFPGSGSASGLYCSVPSFVSSRVRCAINTRARR